MTTRGYLAGAVVLAGLTTILTACDGNPNATGDSESGTVTILGVVIGEQQEKLEQALAPFEAETGIDVIYEGTDAFATLLPVRVDSGNAPDVAMFPQPGLMRDLAEEGVLVPIDTFMDMATLQQAYSPDWIDLATVDGRPYGVWYRASVKSLVWYSPAAFAAAGYEVPQTWDDLIALSETIVSDGGTPWCLGMESGDATGWVGTDWVEDIMLRTAGPEVYDQWVNHQIAFDHPQVKVAFETFGEIALTPEYVVGGTVGVLSTPFGDSPNPLFTDPPGCYLHRQANFIASFFPADVEPKPPSAFSPCRVLILNLAHRFWWLGMCFAMFNDTPEARALMAYLATAQPHEVWAGWGATSPPTSR
jgi:alpha-glucoside transport system substrate-binding protein